MPFQVGPLELIVVLAVALMVLGPKRLPEAGRSLGRGIREFKGSLHASGADDETASNAAEPATKPVVGPSSANPLG